MVPHAFKKINKSRIWWYVILWKLHNGKSNHVVLQFLYGELKPPCCSQVETIGILYHVLARTLSRTSYLNIVKSEMELTTAIQYHKLMRSYYPFCTLMFWPISASWIRYRAHRPFDTIWMLIYRRRILKIHFYHNQYLDWRHRIGNATKHHVPGKTFYSNIK